MFKKDKNFVAFEGIDGSGKGKQIEMLKEYFKSKNRNDVVFTFEHTRANEWSQKIEQIMKGELTGLSMKEIQLLYVLDRKDHLEKVILPNIKKGNLVFCDRYFLSTLAYGSLDKSLHWKTLLEMHKEVIGGDFLIPEKTIFFDLDPDIALARIDNRNNGRTVFESIGKMRLIRESYLSIGPNFEGFEVIDGSKTPEEVFENLKKCLADYL